MSSRQERPAGSSGSTEYEQGQAGGTGYQGRDAGYQGRDTEQVAARDYEAEQVGRARAGRHEENRGARIALTALAGTLMVLGGLWGVIVGIVALSTNHVYIHAPAPGYRYYWTYHGWGWLWLILGIVLFAAGACVFLGMAWARYVGAFVAVLSAIASFMFLPWTPLWSILMIALNGFIIWALLTPRNR